MRVGLVNTYMPPHPGGIEHVALNTFTAYQRAGADVRWVTSRVPTTLPSVEGAITRVPCLNTVEDRLGVPIPLWGRSGWRALRELCAWADVIHIVEALYQPSALAVAAAARARKPVVLCQNVGTIPYDSRTLRAVQHLAWATLGKAVLRRADAVVLATPTAEAFVRGLRGVRLRNAVAIPIGIDTEMFRPGTAADRSEARGALDLDPQRPVVLFAGRLVEKKGVPLVLEAAALSPDVQFLVAGDGPLRHLRDRAPRNSRWLGYVDTPRMRQLYRAADAVVLPSKGEGLPLFVQEAMACGLPAVISEDEIYADALLRAGVCVGSARAGAALAEGIRRALETPVADRQRARAWAEAHWGLEAMARRYLELIARLPSRRPAPRDAVARG